MKKCPANIGKIIIALVLSVIFMSTNAVGDIAPPHSQGETMQPVNITNVQMVDETVHIDVCIENATVKCNFTLMNPGEDESLLVGFPVGLGWDGQGEDPYTYPLEDFKAYVNSQPVETREMDVNGSLWMVWDMSFDEMEIKDVDVSYWVPLSYYGNYGRMASHWFTYVLKTGAAWGGVIEEANIMMVLHDIKPDQITELTPDGYVFENNIITWNFTSLEPTENIYIRFETLREDEYTIPGFVSDENHAGIPDATVEFHYYYPDNSTVGGIIDDVYGEPLVTRTFNGTGGAVGWYNLTNLSDDGADWIDVVVVARVLDAAGNERMGISDPINFWPPLGWDAGTVNVIIDFSSPTGPQDRSLVQVEGQPEVYWLQNGRLYWVTDWNVINDMSGVPGWDSVNTLPASEFDPATYPQGPRFITTGAESNDLLIREQGHPEVYLISGGEKRHFTSPEALLWNGYSFDDVIDVSAAIIGMFSSGSDISITQAIINKYNDLGGEDTFGVPAGTGEQLGYQDSLGVVCSYVNFQNGAIECFTSGDYAGNAYAILNPFFDKWASMGYGKSVLGYPISDMSDVQTSSFGTPSRYQKFINGTEEGSLEYNLTSGDVFEIHGAIYAKWSVMGYSSSILGLVTSDEREAIQSFKGTTGRVSDFENGHLHWHSSGEHEGVTYMTYGELDDLYASMGGTASWLGFPAMDQEERDGHGYCEFEGGYIEWDVVSGGYIAQKFRTPIIDIITPGSFFEGTFNQFNYGTYPMIMEIINVNGLDFDGILHWPTLGDSKTKFRGEIDYISNQIWFTEYEQIQGTSDIVLNGDYFAGLEDNTLNGYWNWPSGGKGGTFSITLAEKPKITKGPKIHMKDTNLVSIYWETSRPTNSLVEYGKSPSSYENDSDPLYLNNYVTEHWVEVPNIDYRQTYYYTITSADRYGNKVESEEYNFKFIASSMVDGYNFSNWPLTDENKKEMKISIDASLDSQGLEYFIPVYNIIKAYLTHQSQFGGHCYGMASTSILYFEHVIDKPTGYEEDIVYNIKKEYAQENIEKYHINQVASLSYVYKAGLDLYNGINKIFDPEVEFSIIFGDPFNGIQEFSRIQESIDLNEPLLMNLLGKEAHAVTPIGYSIRQNSEIIYIYDNNLPSETHEIEFYPNRIKYVDNPYNFEFNYVKSEIPPKDLNGINEILKRFSKYLKNQLGNLKSYMITLKCPADLRIVDQYGRVITTFNGQINEIPDAFLNEGDESEIYILPSDLEYIVELIGTGTGNAELSFANEDIILTFDDIQITPLTRGKMCIGKTNSYILSLDNDNDGIIDEYITPVIDTYTEDGYNITFLPPISAMKQFNLTDGSTLPIKFTAIDNDIGEFIYDDTVNVTITNSTGTSIANFNTTNGVQINSDLEQYAVDFNTMDYYPELTIGETYAIQVTFGDANSLRGIAIAYFTLIDGTPPSAITNPHPTAGTTYLNWTWTNPPDPDFNHTKIYLNGSFRTITSAEHFNATDLAPETEYTISTLAVDTAGNINRTWMNDTATTLPASGTTIQLTIALDSGWNLISAPLNLTIRALGEEAAVGDPLNVTPENSLTSIYRYNTTSELFEKCTHYAGWGWAPATGSGSFTELESGRGYWVMAENECDLTFTGTAPSDLSLPLDAGWNCIGWYSTSVAELGNESLVGDPLNVTPENSLTSIYRYNTTSELFEKCSHYVGWGWEPATGSESFTGLKPGKGYWVMAENDCNWKHET